MYERFASHYASDARSPRDGRPWLDGRLLSAGGYRVFAERYAGTTFNAGLYRFGNASSGPANEQSIQEAFPELVGRFVPFAFDWLGRSFGVDLARRSNGEPLVLMAEPGTGSILEIPVSFVEFHDQELVDYADAALAADFFTRWAGANPDALPLLFTSCVGYQVPLFLGGEDTIENLERINLDVYWRVCAELRRGTISLPIGASIGQITTS